MKEYKSVFAKEIDEFIAFKKGLGYKTEDIMYGLYLFDCFAVENGIPDISFTKAHAEKWQEGRLNESDATKYARLMHFIQFARYLNTLGYDCYIPPYPPAPKNTYMPYIFTHSELEKIFEACDSIALTNGLRSSANTVPAMFRLMYGTGVRVSEAVDLKKQDIDIENRILVVRKSKNGKERMLPFSPSVADACRKYRDSANVFYGKTEYFFTQRNGEPCNRHTMYLWFRRVLLNAGFEHGGKGNGPRLHDFRHTFSVHALAKMADEGLDLYYSLPILSKYLGHESLNATDKYVRLTEAMYPGLLKQANNISAYVFPEVGHGKNK